VAPLSNSRSAVSRRSSRSPGLPGLFVRPVAAPAMIRQNGPHVPIEVQPLLGSGRPHGEQQDDRYPCGAPRSRRWGTWRDSSLTSPADAARDRDARPQRSSCQRRIHAPSLLVDRIPYLGQLAVSIRSPIGDPATLREGRRRSGSIGPARPPRVRPLRSPPPASGDTVRSRARHSFIRIFDVTLRS